MRQGSSLSFPSNRLEERVVKGIPCRQMIKVLSDEQVETIHEASLKILERTGVRFDS